MQSSTMKAQIIKHCLQKIANEHKERSIIINLKFVNLSGLCINIYLIEKRKKHYFATLDRTEFDNCCYTFLI